MSQRTRTVAFLVISTVLLAVPFFIRRVPQDPAYHHFADQRAWLGISNFLNVVSNLPFFAIGAYGIALLLRRGRTLFVDGREAIPFAVLFIAVAAVALGSAYYHLDPSNSTLYWDRLPMSVAFMALLAALIGERIAVAWGITLLPIFILAGIASLGYWQATERAGVGDLRPYAVVQFYPMIAILLLLALFPAKYTRSGDYAAIFALYVAAKLCEIADRQIYSVGHMVSGHTIKHLFAAAACYWIVKMARDRVPMRESRAPAPLWQSAAGGHAPPGA